MRRIALGAVTGLAVWLGSTLVAEAQGPAINTTGPLAVLTGATSSTHTATVTLTTPCTFVVKLWVYKNGVQKHYSATIIPNPGTTSYSFSKFVDMGSWSPVTGDGLLYVAKLCIGLSSYCSEDWPITVGGGTRPTKMTSVQKSSPLAIQSIDRDRRRE